MPKQHQAFCTKMTLALAILFSCQSRLDTKIGESNATATAEWIAASFAKVETQIEAERKQNTGIALESVPVDRIGRGPIWQSILMPGQKSLVTEGELLLGFQTKYGGPTRPGPKAGECIDDLSIQYSNKNKVRKVRFHFKETTFDDSQALFFVYDENSKDLLAAGRFAQKNELICSLPYAEIIVVIGNGAAQTKASFDKSAIAVGLPNLENGKLSLKGLQNLSLVFRLARIQADQKDNETIVFQDSALTNGIYIPLQVSSANMGANELLKTSFLLENQTFDLHLEPGKYLGYAFDPESGYRCQQFLEIKPKRLTEFNCPAPSLSITRNSNHLLDATFWPKEMTESPRFKKWLAVAGYRWVLKSPKNLRGEKNKLDLVDFAIETLLVSKTTTEMTSPATFLGSFSDSITQEQLDRVQFARVASLSTAGRVRNSIDSFQRHAESGVFPLASTGENEWALFGTPFLMQTRVLGESEPWDADETYVSNGPTIEWLDPSPKEQGRLMKMPLQKKFRVRISFPLDFIPGVVDLYVNQKIFRRWNTQTAVSDAKSDIATFEIDEKIELEKDFTISVSTWSNDHLPQLLSGPFGVSPFALSKTYCVDANENALCEAN